MAISIDWYQQIIYIPRADLTLIQSTPSEIREMDLNWFRMQLKGLEDDAAGMPYLRTHKHNTEVTVGGLTLARVIEIINGYTITFEDGQYAVNLVGANSNVGDVVNVNQVSVRTANSAGMISSPAIEYASYQNGVWVVQGNGVEGTLFPIGTPMRPVGNLLDAKLIADYRGFNTLYLYGPLTTFDSVVDFDGFVFRGQSHVNNEVIISDAAMVQGVVLNDLTVSGILDGGNDIRECIVKDIQYVNGHIHSSALTGKIVLAGDKDAFILNCSQMDVTKIPEIDMGGFGQNLSMPNYSGELKITNLDSNLNYVAVGLSAGQVILDSATVLSGMVYVSGNGTLTDENGVPIISGTWNGDVTVVNNLINRENVAESVLNNDLGQFSDSDGTVASNLITTDYGEKVYIDTIRGISGTDYPRGTKGDPVNNLDDAVAIAQQRGIKTLEFLSDYTFEDGTYIDGYTLVGQGANVTTFTFVADTLGCIVANCKLVNAKATGHMTGVIGFEGCAIVNLGSIGLVPSSQDITVYDSTFSGTTTLPNNYTGNIHVFNCRAVLDDNGNPTVVDMSGGQFNVSIRNLSGSVKFQNCTQATNILDLYLSEGKVILDSASVTAGMVNLFGIGDIRDENGIEIPSGTWNGGVTVVDASVNQEDIADSVWDAQLGSDNNEAGSAGEALNIAQKAQTNKATIVTQPDNSEIVTIYDDDGISILYQLQVSEDKKTRTVI